MIPDSISDTHFLRRGACNPLYFRQQTQSLIGGKNTITRRRKSVNILRKGSCRVTTSLSVLCKTYCFTFQKRRFCKVKAALLRCKRAAFATPKRRCRFLKILFLQSWRGFCGFAQRLLNFLGKLDSLEEKTGTKKENAPLYGAFSIIFRGADTVQRENLQSKCGRKTDPETTSDFTVFGGSCARCFTVRSTLLSNQNY